MMSYILDPGLPDELIIIKNLAKASPKKRNQQTFKLMYSQIDEVFVKLENYLQNLPDPDLSLTVEDRIVILNCRTIFHGLTILFDNEIASLCDKFRRDLRFKFSSLKAKESDTSKSIKKKKSLEPKEVESFLIEEPPEDSFRGLGSLHIRIGRDTLWAPGTFDDDDVLRGEPTRAPPSFVPDIKVTEILPLLETTPHIDVHFPPALGDHIQTPPRHSIEFTEREPSHRPFELDAEIPVIPTPHLVETSQRDVPCPTLEQPPRDQKSYELELEELILHGTPPKAARRRSRQGFLPEPVKNTEKYTKFLLRGKRKDPVEFYVKRHSRDHLFIQPDEERQVEIDLFDHDCGIAEPKGTIPFYGIPFYLRRDAVISSPQDNVQDFPIEEFELPPLEGVPQRPVVEFPRDDDERLADTLRDGRMDRTVDLHITRREVLDRSSWALPDDIRISAGLQFPDQTGTDFQLRIDSSLEETRIPIPVHRESRREPGTVSPVITSRFISTNFEDLKSEIWELLIQLCSNEENLTVKFTELCPLSETTLIASRVFTHILNLMRENKIDVQQASSHPDDIFINIVQ